LTKQQGRRKVSGQNGPAALKFVRTRGISDSVVSMLTMAMLTLQTDINEVNKDKREKVGSKTRSVCSPSFK
jgi:hypothetical protein